MNSSSLLVLCNLAVALCANIEHQPRGLSVRAAGSFAQSSDGFRRQQRRETKSQSTKAKGTADVKESEEPKEVEAGAPKPLSKVARAVGGVDDQIRSQVHDFFYSLQDHIAQLQALGNSNPTPRHAQDTIAAFFRKLQEGMMKTQAFLASSNSPNGPGKAELRTFFTHLNENMMKLESALVQPDETLDQSKSDLKDFFAHEGEEMVDIWAKLGALGFKEPQEGHADVQDEPSFKVRRALGGSDDQIRPQVEDFLSSLQDSMTQLQALGNSNVTPGQAQEKIAGFFSKLEGGMMKMQAELASSSSPSHELQNGPGKAQLRRFFTHLNENIVKLQLMLLQPNETLDQAKGDLKTFFAHEGEEMVDIWANMGALGFKKTGTHAPQAAITDSQ